MGCGFGIWLGTTVLWVGVITGLLVEFCVVVLVAVLGWWLYAFLEIFGVVL